MARRKTEGEVIARETKKGRKFALRFRAYGERRYVTLGYEGEGDPPLDAERAEEILDDTLADVRRKLWVAPPKRRPKPKAAGGAGGRSRGPVLFGPFARGLVEDRKDHVSENQHEYREWGLSHLIPFFGEIPLLEIDAELIDEYVITKVKEAAKLAAAIERGRPRRDSRGMVRKPLSAVSINKTVDILQWVLGIGVEYKKRTGLTENAAIGENRRVKEPDRRPVHLDTAEQIEGLLVACAELDRDPRCHCEEREAIVATLVFAGPRAEELCHLLWRDVDLANGRIFIGRSKTQAGLREIPLEGILRDILAAHKARAYRSGPDDLVFPTGTGGRRTKDNLRQRVLELAFERADEILLARGMVPLPIGVTAHKLRHTFASVMTACGEDPIAVMEALGHTYPVFTLRTYTHMMRRDKAERDRLKALVKGERVLALEAPPPEILALADYEPVVLRGLVDLGGRAKNKDVVEFVGEALAGRHGTKDLEKLPSGEPRWKPRLRRAYISLEQRGWIEPTGTRGGWRRTKVGRAKAVRDAARVTPVEQPERRLRLVA
ncbi:MAG: tyrosine-type recombinase/integrase [Actinobacteria bacterium]|nr:tyrosine-type recombinase/integrase [Actinomycetota bacterium]